MREKKTMHRPSVIAAATLLALSLPVQAPDAAKPADPKVDKLDTVVVTGMAASMGSILLSGAPKGRRLLYPHSRVLIHQPLISGRFSGPATDINIQAQEMEKLRAELNQILATASGQPLERIDQDTDRDFYLTAKEAIAYGLADRIVDKV